MSREAFRELSWAEFHKLPHEEKLRLAKEQTAQRMLEEQRVRRSLTGGSLVHYANGEIDFSVNLLGNRWLSRKTGAFIVAPSGHGKSTLVAQMAACWGCGRACCSIKPPKPLRVFIAQAEDDDNDLIEMAQMMNRMNLSAKELELIDRNTHAEWMNDCAGKVFFESMDELLTDWPADLLVINPYTAFQTEDIQDNAANADFLRVKLSRLLAKHNIGCIIVHHTGKTQFQKKNDFAWFDWMYDMAGGAVLTNWARAVLIIAPSSNPGTYKFIAAKRFEKIGWQEREYWFAHSTENDRMLWVPADSDQIACGKTAGSASHEDLLPFIPLLDPASEDKIHVDQKPKLHLGEKRVHSFLKLLLETGKIFIHSFPRKGTRPEIRYAKTPQ